MLKLSKGFSIVELMVSITLGLILMAGVVQMFLSSKTSSGSQQGLSDVQETGRLAIEFLSRDLRMLGHYGCFTPNATLNTQVSVAIFGTPLAGFQTNFNVGLMAYVAPHATPFVPAFGGTPLPDTQVLVIHKVMSSPDAIFQVTGSNTSTAVSVTSRQSPIALDANQCVSGYFCPNSVAVVSDCVKAKIFQVSPAPSISGTTITIPHAAQNWGGSNVQLDPYNFSEGAEVLPMQTVVYFMATGSNGPGLFQQIDGGAPGELLSNVENIAFTFGIPNGGAMQYKTVATMNNPDWDKVSVVRIEVVARSSSDKLLDNVSPYRFNGAQVIPNNKKIYKVFSATVALRERN